jgi:predicted nucleotidyltransferase
MSLEELRQKFGKEWPALAKARLAAGARFEQIRKIVREGAGGTSFDSGAVAVVVFGSLARYEWTSGSDLDWTLLIDGGVDVEHARTASLLRANVEAAGLKQPGPTGVFGSMTFSHALIHLIGGEDDTNRNTTRRMLLLLESRPIDADGAYQRVIDAVLNRYLQNDFREFRPAVPRFLLNDLHRFWRTMCVDYASKYRERAGKGWATRIIKLRMSRKLIFAAGLLSCFECDPKLNPNLASQASQARQVEFLSQRFRRPPLDTVSEALLKWGQPASVDLIFDSYDCFLSAMDDQAWRDHLDHLPVGHHPTDSRLRDLMQWSRDFEQGLLQLFFDSHPRLAALTRQNGVF